MTQPGITIPPLPGWWVRTEHVGAIRAGYGWALVKKTRGQTAGSYGWAGAAFSTGGTEFPYVFPFTIAGETITAANQNTQATTINALGAGTTPIPKTPLVSAASTLVLTSAHNVFVYSGSTTAAWTLPAVSGPKLVLYCFNRGSAAVTITRAGTDQILNNGVLGTSVALAAGKTLQLLNDGTYWIVVSS